jgi:hypothetical protein
LAGSHFRRFPYKTLSAATTLALIICPLCGEKFPTLANTHAERGVILSQDPSNLLPGLSESRKVAAPARRKALLPNQQ